MLQLIIWVTVFIFSLFVLVRASAFFTDAAEVIGRSFRIPEFIVGVTIVAIGTSLPEIISSIFAVMNDASEIVVGNVIGSNIANIFLVIGLIAIISKKIKIKHGIIHTDLPLLIGSAFFLAVTIIDGKFSLFEALLCIAGFIVYIFHAVKFKRKREDPATLKKSSAELRVRIHPKTLVILATSTIFIYIGARYTIEAVIKLSEFLKIGKEVIAASAIAIGTSLPEMTVSIIAARKGKPEIAIGNVLGSNIFNVFMVMGIPALFGTLIIPKNIVSFGLPILLVATFLFLFMTQDREIRSSEGWLLLIFYVFFIGKLFRLY
ncbi:MAG: calcium/sodium antiporter [Candidatus Cloacimonadota bacterium]|nr:MAG: calcium/sodium antiporter [Candidatus Cloacimonadota bacterium]